MDYSEAWRALFQHWPEQIERKGSIMSKQGEFIGFDNFLIPGGILLLERNAPDASGARKAFISFDSIAIVKLPTTMPIGQFQSMGFRPPAPRPQPNGNRSPQQTRPRPAGQ